MFSAGGDDPREDVDNSKTTWCSRECGDAPKRSGIVALEKAP